jgi:hypothetical protein
LNKIPGRKNIFPLNTLIEKQKLILFTDDVQMTRQRDANVQTGDTNEKKNETDYAGDNSLQPAFLIG